MTTVFLCRCGYPAGSETELGRHIASWLKFFTGAGQAYRGLEHVED